MCRLCAITATQIDGAPDRLKAQLLHEVMIRTCHDEAGQKDGWGVTDFHKTWKSPTFYFEDVPTYINELDTSGFVMSHLRKASANTGRTKLDNHPYTFEVNGDTLTAAHNGFFEGSVSQGWKQNEPNTDSFRALTVLADKLAETNQITPELLNEWLSLYGDMSHYAVLLHWKGQLHALRGKTRPLGLMPIGNGYMLHTNIAALKWVKEYVWALYGIDCSAPLAINDNTLVTFNLGQSEYQWADLHPVHTRVVYQTRYEHTPPKPVAAALPVVVNTKRDDVDDITVNDGGYVIAPSVTKARTVRTSLNNSAAITKKQQVDTLVGKLSPLRKELSRVWIAAILGHVDDQDTPLPHVMLKRITDDEIELLDKTLFLHTADGKWMKPFSPVAMQMLNWWNHMIKDGQDVEAHYALFNKGWFWLDHRWTQMQNTRGTTDDTVYVMHAWTHHMLQKIIRLNENQIQRWIDPTMLASAIEGMPIASDMIGAF